MLVYRSGKVPGVRLGEQADSGAHCGLVFMQFLVIGATSAELARAALDKFLDVLQVRRLTRQMSMFIG